MSASMPVAWTACLPALILLKNETADELFLYGDSSVVPNFQWSASTGDFARRPELCQLPVASSCLIVWARHSEDVVPNWSKVRTDYCEDPAKALFFIVWRPARDHFSAS